MKKSNLILIGLMSASMLLTGCSDSFLESEPQTKATLEEYFSTKEHIQEALNAAYNPMHSYDYNVDQDGDGQYTPLNFSDVMADIMLVGAADPTDQEIWHLAANYSSTPLNAIYNVWNTSYKGIKRANDVLYYLEEAGNKLSTAEKNAIAAEARVLRAWYYCQVWKFYGNIPYFQKALTLPYHADQLSADQIYANNIADLEGAIALNALPMSWDADNLGRVSLAMAYMLYAEMVLYQNDTSRYATALQFMNAIIGDPNYDLAPDYTQIFTPGGEWSKESIFEINYTDGPTAGRAYDNINAIGGTILPKVISPDGGSTDASGKSIESGWGTFIVRQSTYDMYDAADKRRGATCFLPTNSYKKRYQDTGIFLNKYLARNKASDTGGAPDMGFSDNYRVYRYAETLLNAAELLVLTGGDLTVAKGYITDVRQRAGLTTQVDATIDNILNERKLEFVGEGKRYWDLIRTGKAATVLVADGVYRTKSWNVNKKYLPISQKEISAAEGSLRQNEAYLNN